MEYSEISLIELLRMREDAFAAYYSEATRPCGDWRPGMRFTELEEAERKYNEICSEIERRLNLNV